VQRAEVEQPVAVQVQHIAAQLLPARQSGNHTAWAYPHNRRGLCSKRYDRSGTNLGLGGGDHRACVDPCVGTAATYSAPNMLRGILSRGRAICTAVPAQRARYTGRMPTSAPPVRNRAEKVFAKSRGKVCQQTTGRSKAEFNPMKECMSESIKRRSNVDQGDAARARTRPMRQCQTARSTTGYTREKHACGEPCNLARIGAKRAVHIEGATGSVDASLVYSACKVCTACV
jgi:hypothetical protein